MASQDRTVYAERLSVPWWAWPIGMGLALGLAAELGLGFASGVAWVALVVLLPVMAALLWWSGNLVIRVNEDDFHVDDATLPRRYIAKVEPLSGTPLRDALSAGLHPIAFVIQRPWVRGAVRVWLNDDNDPTPYWIISTRRPAELSQALSAAQDASTDAAPPAVPHR